MSTLFKNPYTHSLIAELYIIMIALGIHFLGKPNTPDTIFSPMIALSVFTLSAAVMGYLFLGEPLQLYLDGKRKEAVSFFFQTVMGFAVLILLTMLTSKYFS